MECGNRETEQGRPAVRRPLALFCLAFSGAVFGALYLLSGWQQLLLGALLLFAGLVCALKRLPRGALALLGLALGLWLSWYQAASLALLEQEWAGKTAELELRVQEEPERTRYGVYVRTQIQTEGALKGVILELFLPEGQGLLPGDCLRGTVAIDSARESNPLWENYALSQGVRLAGTASCVTVERGEVPWTLWPRLWAARLGSGLERCFSRETAGFLYALTTGNRGLLSQSMDDALTAAGLQHILAASGLHIHLLFSALGLLPIGRRKRGIVLLPLLVLYAALAGFTPSICRAAVMEGIFLLGPLFERESDGLTSLSVALAALLAQNRYAAASVSLQLSFAAVFGLRVICPALLRRCEERRTPIWLRKVRNGLIAALGANVFTLPLVLYYFGSVSLLSPVSNLAVLWLLPVLLPLALTAGLGGWLCPVLGRLLAVLAAPLAELVQNLIVLLAKFPWSTLSETPGALIWLGMCYAAGLILFLFHCSVRQTAAAVLAALLLLPLVFQASALPQAALTAALLDVGQGQCLLLRAGEETAVVDCGSTGGQAALALEQAMRRTGAERIDALILTHYDTDHTNGVVKLLLEGKVERLYLPPALEEDEQNAQALRHLAQWLGVSVFAVAGDERVSLGSAVLRLCPMESAEYQGLAVWVSREEFDLLVTGDADQAAEAALMRQEPLGSVEVLVAGHHGSAYATGETLLEAIQPELVLFSVGRNPYGHPTQQTLDRCLTAGAQLRRTDLNGTIWISVGELSSNRGK